MRGAVFFDELHSNTFFWSGSWCKNCEHIPTHKKIEESHCQITIVRMRTRTQIFQEQKMEHSDNDSKDSSKYSLCFYWKRPGWLGKRGNYSQKTCSQNSDAKKVVFSQVFRVLVIKIGDDTSCGERDAVENNTQCCDFWIFHC